MNRPVLARLIKTSADPGRASRSLKALLATDAGKVIAEFSEEQLRVLVALLSGSQALTASLVAHPDWLKLFDLERLEHPRRKQGLASEMNSILQPLLQQRDYAAALRHIREFKARELLRIAARDLGRLANAVQVTLELSAVADVTLQAVWQVCLQQLVERHGQPYHQDASGRWRITGACVLGMGKLGGQELNYSSDVDVLFVYAEEGSVFKDAPAKRKEPKPSLTNHQFFNRLAESFISEVGRATSEGVLYRIDLRLRPEGKGGPLSRSLPSYENYYAQWGQTWERMMLIKARGVSGDEVVAAEFLETINPFRYPRSVGGNVLHEIGLVKDRIENEVVKTGELERNVKLGWGGIREIEFVAQSLQLLHAGRQPFLQGAQTLPCLNKLVQYELLSRQDSRALSEAYCFLRDVEHRLQMEDNLQTHTIPTSIDAQERLAKLMGLPNAKEFWSVLKSHTKTVQSVFVTLLKSELPQSDHPTTFPREFEGHEEEWKRLLTAHGFKDPEKACRMLREFVEGPGYVHVSPRTTALAFQLLPKLFALCPTPALSANAPAASAAKGNTGFPSAGSAPLSDPDRVVTRLDSFVGAYGARATLFEVWNSTPRIFELLVLLFDRSEFLAELSIRTPDLVDELVMSGRLRQRKTAEETLRDLRHGIDDKDQHLWLRRYHQAELMRIGLRDILGLSDFEQYLEELSGLADACLQYALEVALRQHRLKRPPFAIIGLGKLGGTEIDYGSDLDILFVADPKAGEIDRLCRAAVTVMDLMSQRTELGLLFQTDSRLRPDGQKGLLVNHLTAYEEYYRQRAQLWEIQSLTRTRVVAGNSAVGERFQQMVRRLTNFKQPPDALASYDPEWKQTIHQMRLRIEKERTPAGKDELAIKTGVGGLMDAEFVAQALCLESGWHEANTLVALERARDKDAREWLNELIRAYRQLRRVEGILRRWSYEGETVLPDDPAPFYRVSIRCGFSGPDDFRAALAGWRRAIRHGYRSFFGG
jgi:glutamate-ammonia-ligase adenylyltransferase